MRSVSSILRYIPNLSKLLYILLFVYAASSKLLDFQNFQTQLGQSPLLGAFAIPIAYGVIIIEILTSLILALEKTRIVGLYIAYILMVMFTAYIVVILNFTSFTPCSCGGVLEDLSWTEHLIFNCAFIALALWAIFLSKKMNKKQLAVRLLLMTLIAVCIIVGLFLISDNKMKQNNAFQRKYVPHALSKVGVFELESDAFYIAGIDSNNIYLGNYNAPLYLKAVDVNLDTFQDIKIEIDNYTLPYQRVRTNVNDSDFFIGDGTVPVILHGKTNNWQAKTFSYNDAYFYQFAVIDSSTLVLSTTSTSTKSNALGILHLNQDSISFNLQPDILKSQSTGTFDTDGILLWNNQNKNVVYVYYYRNQYEIANSQLIYQSTGKTIDTIEQAQIDVDYYKKEAHFKIGKSVVVNRYASTYGDQLYINSDHLGRFEDGEILKSASIIDQYKISDNAYLQSFYFYHQPNQKLGEFKVEQNLIVGLVDNQLWVYRIRKDGYFKE